MATKSDLELAKLLLSNRILDEASVRQAFEQQGSWLRQGRVEALPEVLYTLDLLPRGALNALFGPGPERTQPFANYRIDGVLGEGGMSMVYSAVYLPNGTPVALKVLKPIPALRGDFLERFQREARLLVNLEHPNVVAAYELVAEAGYHYFSMDIVEGATVLDVIERRGFLTNTEALSVIWQTGQALDYLHGRGLLHRDIKPGNVMVEASGRARLIDLGLVGRLRPPTAPGATPSGPESTGLTVGTVEYVSPEQARGRTDLDPRSDIYSLGISLYHMVVGEVPFQGESDYEVMAKQILTSMESGKMKQRRITPEVHYFIAKMSAKERESRFTTLSDLVREVGAYLPGGPVPIDLGAPPRVMPMAQPVTQPVERGGGGRFPSPAREIPVARAIPTAQPVGGVPVARPLPQPPMVKPVGPPPLVQPVGSGRPGPAARGGGPPPLRPVEPPTLQPFKPPTAVPVVPPVARPAVRAAIPAAIPVAKPVPTAAPIPRPAIAPPPLPIPTVKPVVAVAPAVVPVVAPTPRPAPVAKAEAPPPAAPAAAPSLPKPAAPPPPATQPAPGAASAAPPPAAGPAPVEPTTAPAKDVAGAPSGDPKAPPPRPTKGQAPIPKKRR